MRSAGARDTQVLIQASTVERVDGRPRQVWTDIVTLWASVETRGFGSQSHGEIETTRPVKRLRFDWMDGQRIEGNQRIVIEGEAYDIRYIDSDSDRRSILMVEVEGVSDTAGAARQEWEKKMRRAEIVRIKADGNRSIMVRAIGEFLEPSELVGGVQQGARRWFVPAEDVEGDIETIERGMDVVVRGSAYFIETVDDVTYRYGDDLVAYVLITRGGQ